MVVRLEHLLSASMRRRGRRRRARRRAIERSLKDVTVEILPVSHHDLLPQGGKPPARRRQSAAFAGSTGRAKTRRRHASSCIGNPRPTKKKPTLRRSRNRWTNVPDQGLPRDRRAVGHQQAEVHQLRLRQRSTTTNVVIGRPRGLVRLGKSVDTLMIPRTRALRKRD